jgi:hypothetical protein
MAATQERLEATMNTRLGALVATQDKLDASHKRLEATMNTRLGELVATQDKLVDSHKRLEATMNTHLGALVATHEATSRRTIIKEYSDKLISGLPAFLIYAMMEKDSRGNLMQLPPEYFSLPDHNNCTTRLVDVDGIDWWKVLNPMCANDCHKYHHCFYAAAYSFINLVETLHDEIQRSTSISWNDFPSFANLLKACLDESSPWHVLLCHTAYMRQDSRGTMYPDFCSAAVAMNAVTEDGIIRAKVHGDSLHSHSDSAASACPSSSSRVCFVCP